MIVLLASLVGLGYFAKVRLSFLIIEHTNEDIDERFWYDIKDFER